MKKSKQNSARVPQGISFVITLFLTYTASGFFRISSFVLLAIGFFIAWFVMSYVMEKIFKGSRAQRYEKEYLSNFWVEKLQQVNISKLKEIREVTTDEMSGITTEPGGIMRSAHGFPVGENGIIFKKTPMVPWPTIEINNPPFCSEGAEIYD